MAAKVTYKIYTLVLFEEPILYGGSSNAWWNEIRRDYLNLPELSWKFILMFGALCFAAVLLILLSCMTALRLRQWFCREEETRRAYLNGESGGLLLNPKTYSTSHKIRKRDKQIYHEANFFGVQDPIGDLSPLGCYDNDVRR